MLFYSPKVNKCSIFFFVFFFAKNVGNLVLVRYFSVLTILYMRVWCRQAILFDFPQEKSFLLGEEENK